MQVRNHGGAGAVSKAGAYAQTALPVAGFALIDADRQHRLGS